MIQLVQSGGRLTCRRSAGKRSANIVLNRLERGAILSARPHVRQPLGRFRKGPGKTALVATRDDDGTLVTKGLPDNLDESLSRRQRRTLKFLLLDQPIDERMRRPNEDQRRLLVWFAKAIGRQCHGNRDACGFESEPRRQLDGAGGSIARWTEQHVEPIGNAVVVRVAQPSVIGVEIRQRAAVLRRLDPEHGRPCFLEPVLHDGLPLAVEHRQADRPAGS